MPLKLLLLQEQDIPAFAALDDAATGHSRLARAMSLSAPPDAPPRQKMIEDWTRKGFAAREDSDKHYLKVVDTDLPSKDGASDEGEIVAVALWSFEPGQKPRRTEEAKEEGVVEQGEEKKEEGPRATGVGVVMRRQWERLKKDFFPDRPFANLNILVTHPTHQRRGAGSMLVKWGTDEADRRGVISVLVATDMGLGCYLKNGFGVVREDEMDLASFGVDEVELRRGMVRQLGQGLGMER